jgi:hypothetical protein
MIAERMPWSQRKFASICVMKKLKKEENHRFVARGKDAG